MTRSARKSLRPQRRRVHRRFLDKAHLGLGVLLCVVSLPAAARGQTRATARAVGDLATVIAQRVAPRAAVFSARGEQSERWENAIAAAGHAVAPAARLIGPDSLHVTFEGVVVEREGEAEEVLHVRWRVTRCAARASESYTTATVTRVRCGSRACVPVSEEWKPERPEC